MVLEFPTLGLAKDAITQDHIRLREGSKSLGTLAGAVGQGGGHELIPPQLIQCVGG